MIKRLISLAALLALTLPFGAAHADPTPTTTRAYMTSFDGTHIVYNLFEPDAAANAPGHGWPIVFMTHGWGGTGQTTISGFLKRLLDNGYAVITWDERGFGNSGGEANVDDPGFEGRDLSSLIDMIAADHPEIQHEGPRWAHDIRMGMIGGSYAGGIQLAGAAFDPRIDAIVPQITWHDLRYSLFPGNVIKFGFDEALYGVGLAGAVPPDTNYPLETGVYAKEIHESEVKGLALGAVDDTTLNWFKGRSMAGYDYGHPVRVPTLLEQGNVDTLFNVDEAVQNFNDIAETGAQAKLIVFCGGHVSCPSTYKPNDGGHVDDMSLAWLDRYVKDDEDANTGPRVEAYTNVGTWITGEHGFPDLASSSVTVPVSGQVVNSGTKTSALNQQVGVTYATPSDPNDPGTITVPTNINGTIVGIPHVSVDVTGVGPGVHLFFKLVDTKLNQVVDLQEAAIRVENLSSTPQHIELDMPGVSFVTQGDPIVLQVATSSTAMAEYRGASVAMVAGSVTVPMQ